MHAVLVRVKISDVEGSMDELRERVVPGVAQAPGFITGHWTRKDDTGVSLTVFESEDAATAASERVRDSAPEGVTVESVEVREVVAHA
jgi:heme-degrading monooxygenase HmoA